MNEQRISVNIVSLFGTVYCNEHWLEHKVNLWLQTGNWKSAFVKNSTGFIETHVWTFRLRNCTPLIHLLQHEAGKINIGLTGVNMYKQVVSSIIRNKLK